MSAIATSRVTHEIRASLLARVAALERLWDLVTQDLTLEHVNHFERAGVLPIALRESGYRLLMRSLAAAGNAAAAAGVMEECRAALGAVGASPSAETDRVFRSVLAG